MSWALPWPPLLQPPAPLEASKAPGRGETEMAARPSFPELRIPQQEEGGAPGRPRVGYFRGLCSALGKGRRLEKLSEAAWGPWGAQTRPSSYESSGQTLSFLPSGIFFGGSGVHPKDDSPAVPVLCRQRRRPPRVPPSRSHLPRTPWVVASLATSCAPPPGSFLTV